MKITTINKTDISDNDEGTKKLCFSIQKNEWVRKVKNAEEIKILIDTDKEYKATAYYGENTSEIHILMED